MTPRKEACRACEDAAKLCDDLENRYQKEGKGKSYEAHDYALAQEGAARECAEAIRSSCRHDDRDAQRFRKLVELWAEESFGIFTEAQEVSIYLHGKVLAREKGLVAAIDAALGAEGRE